MKNFIKKIFLMCLIVSFFPINYLVIRGVGRNSLVLKREGVRPFVTCHLNWQIGNQLFQVATVLAHAWDHELMPIFPDLQRTDLNIPINRKRVFFRLDASGLPRPIQKTFKCFRNHEKIKIPVEQDLQIDGLFQTWEYFDHHRARILDTFAPHPEETDQIKLKYAKLLNHPLTVGVHVRTFNKTWSKSNPFVGLAYYEKALNYFPPEALFVVFSDRINWCKHHFKKFNRQMIFMEGQDYIEVLFLMSMLKHNIIGNSTFSWWAAYLNRNPNKIVIAPSHFVFQKIKVTHANLPDWITIQSNRDHSIDPYPEDMYDYDAVSQSIDTQAEEKVLI